MKGCTHIYFGDGKGKTTAAMGLAIRAAGNDKKVFIIQFLKGGPTGELKILLHLSFPVSSVPSGQGGQVRNPRCFPCSYCRFM